VVASKKSRNKMATHGINAIGVLIGNPDEIVFVLTKGDVERVYNMMNHLPLGTPPPEAVWSAFKNNSYRLDDRLDHAAAIEDILAGYCRVPVTIAPPPPVSPVPAPNPVVYSWDDMRRKKYDTKKFTPPGYGHHVVWSAHRVRAFMLALKLKPTVYDTNLRTLAKIAGVHPYDFIWKTNPIVFGGSRGLSDWDMKRMMGSHAFYEMQQRFYNY
jgi:hypothetical protein